jgi:hypothetical protein
MKEDRNTRGTRRYVALDIHKQYCVVAGVDREGRVVLQPVRVEHADLEGWLKKHLGSTDQVVLESTTNAWHVYDLLAPLVERCQDRRGMSRNHRCKMSTFSRHLCPVGFVKLPVAPPFLP